MKPRLVAWRDGWVCQCSKITAWGTTTLAAYNRWLQLHRERNAGHHSPP